MAIISLVAKTAGNYLSDFLVVKRSSKMETSKYSTLGTQAWWREGVTSRLQSKDFCTPKASMSFWEQR